jgi:hypothetical protein
MVSIENYQIEDKSQLISFLSKSGFMESSTNPRDSVIASVLDYQDQTNNYGVLRGVLLKNQDGDIVGFLGVLAFPIMHEKKQLIGIQTSSAFISPEYPGNFKKMLAYYHDQTKNYIRYSIFPVPKIFTSFEKYNYKVLTNSTYNKQYYRIINTASFFHELTEKRKVLKPIISLTSFIFYKRFKKRSNNTFRCQRMDSINNDYTQIEQDYKKRNHDLIRPIWDKKIINYKFGNKLHIKGNPIRENEVIHICCSDQNNTIVGSLFAKKIRGLNRLIISDIQTVSYNYKDILIELLQILEQEAKQFGFNSYMVIGIDQIYLEFIISLNITWSKSSNLRTYVLPNKENEDKNYKIVYSDDDINF